MLFDLYVQSSSSVKPTPEMMEQFAAMQQMEMMQQMAAMQQIEMMQQMAVMEMDAMQQLAVMQEAAITETEGVKEDAPPQTENLWGNSKEKWMEAGHKAGKPMGIGILMELNEVTIERTKTTPTCKYRQVLLLYFAILLTSIFYSCTLGTREI